MKKKFTNQSNIYKGFFVAVLKMREKKPFAHFVDLSVNNFERKCSKISVITQIKDAELFYNAIFNLTL